jgi:RNA ligase (TIGR02306 family)
MTKSCIVKIEDVKPHPDADRLDVVTFEDYSWSCVTARGTMSIGDLAVYFETDSVLPQSLIDLAFKDSKIKPDNGRIRAIKIRGVFSEGLLLPLSIDEKLAKLSKNADTDSILGVTKYEPPEIVAGPQKSSSSKKVRKSLKSRVDKLPRYIDTVRIEKVKTLFSDDELVHVTAKLHGTSVRYGWGKITLKNPILNFLRNILVMLGLIDAYKFVYGSRNVDFPSDQLYKQVADSENLEEILPKNYTLFGEIVGFSKGGKPIQGNGYTYGCSKGKCDFYAYALMIDGKYQDYDVFCEFCDDECIARVPLLMCAQWGNVNKVIKDIRDGKNCLTDIEKDIPCREGVVVGSVKEQHHSATGQRKVVKMINPNYLLNKHNTDEH